MTKIPLRKWRNKKTAVLAITGGVATGKSFVAAYFRQAGAKVIDADRIARQVVRKGTPVYRNIVREFKEGVLKSDGTIDRKKLGEIIFSNPAARKKLEELTHPAIIKMIKEKVAAYGDRKKPGIIVIDAPLLFEAGLERIVDAVLLVSLPRRMQIARLMKRDRISDQEAVARIGAQMPTSKKGKMSDFVIDNSLSPAVVKKTLRIFFRKHFFDFFHIPLTKM